MYIVLLIFLSLLESGAVAWFLWVKFGKLSISQSQANVALKEALEKRVELEEQFNGLIEQAASAYDLRMQGDRYKDVNDSLKAERGRIAITQAELETVENHLRELDVIEQELEASSIETQEEINILMQKREVLLDKKEQLNTQLSDSDKKISDALAKIEMSTQMREKIDNMRVDLTNTQRQVDDLLLKIQQGQEQYSVLKRRYDALDIEYAQLYEKFTMAEG